MPLSKSPCLHLLSLSFIALVLSGCADSKEGSSTSTSGGEEKIPKVAYVTNGVASFWVIAEKGAMDAGKEFNAEVSVYMPVNGVEDQKSKCQDMLAKGIEGIAISPIDPENQADLLAEISQHTNLITTDADAPDSERLAYVGMDNYTAGRVCGELVKEALPDGGKIMIFVGRLGQLNARLRRQGLIDELLDRDPDPNRYDDPSAGEIKGDKFTILDTRTDGFDFGKAKAQAQDAIAKYDDLAGMVGLFAYNPPLMLDAVREAGKLDQIKIVAFDEDERALQGIKDGEIFGTVVQDPYKYGYESVRVLAALARGEKDVIPEGGFPYIPYRVIRQDNVDEFWTELKGLMATDTAPADSKGDASDEDQTGEKPASEEAAIDQQKERVVAYADQKTYTVKDVQQAVYELEEWVRISRDHKTFDEQTPDLKRCAERFAKVGAIVAQAKQDVNSLDASKRAFKLLQRFAGPTGVSPEKLEQIRELQTVAAAAI